VVGFAVGGADHLSPQIHSLCLWWLRKAAKLHEHVKTSGEENEVPQIHRINK
jgi:hypothetical protein